MNTQYTTNNLKQMEQWKCQRACHIVKLIDVANEKFEDHPSYQEDYNLCYSLHIYRAAEDVIVGVNVLDDSVSIQLEYKDSRCFLGDEEETINIPIHLFESDVPDNEIVEYFISKTLEFNLNEILNTETDFILKCIREYDRLKPALQLIEEEGLTSETGRGMIQALIKKRECL